MIKTRIEKLRKLMVERNIDVYLVPTADYHQSEYICDYFKCREYISGFTGSAGTVVITKDQAGLWTDGRYFIQASKQIENTGITLYKMGVENTISILDFIKQNLNENNYVGFDGKCVSANMGKSVENVAKFKKALIKDNEDLIDLVYDNRPLLPKDKAFILDIKYCGKSLFDKVNDVKKAMEKNNCTKHITCALDEICWLLNIRGNDVLHTPVVLSYCVISQDGVELYIDKSKLDEQMLQYFKDNNVVLHDYFDIINDLANIKDQTIWLDGTKASYSMLNVLNKNNTMINQPSSIVLAKAIKNEVEIANVKQSHIIDGVCVTKFMYWLKHNYDKQELSEIDASDYLENLRKEMGAIDSSFSTIAAVNENAASMHYSATKEKHSMIKKDGIILVDSGGQYLQGTTDITRTIALGNIKPEWKRLITIVLKGMLNLSNAKFLYGCTGQNLDILARNPIWQHDLDYQCGTGHGIGYLLGVHEGPHGFRWQKSIARSEDTRLEHGMIITNEPGIYLPNDMGVRIENELIVTKGNKNEYGQFMYLDTITFAPIDLDSIDKQYLNNEEIKQLNDYHNEVYLKISPYLNDDEKVWLKQYTKAI